MNSYSTVTRILGEIVVIVFGILLAFAADTWINERGQRLKEAEHLSAVLLDFQASLATLRRAIDFKTQQIADLQLLLTVGSKGLQNEKLEQVVVRGVYTTSDYVPSLSALRDLEASGSFALISDPVIRRGLSLLNTRLEDAERSMKEYITFHQADLDPFIAKSLPVVGVLSKISNAPVETIGLEDWSQLDSDMARGLLVFKMSLAANYVQVLERLADQFETLIEDIQTTSDEPALRRPVETAPNTRR
ncbi:hypothetical protein [Congregibacter sp.]